MNDEKQEFIESIKNDEFSEWKISDNLILVTDWEGDGYFLPYVLDLDSKYSEEEIVHILENAASDVFTFEVLEFDDSNEDSYDLYYPEGISCEYENYDMPKVLLDVEKDE